MSGLQEFVSAQVGLPLWLNAPAIEPPEEQEMVVYTSTLAARPIETQETVYTLADLANPTLEHYKRARKSFYESFYEYLLRVTPRGYQPDIPSAASNFGYLKRRLNASSAAVKNSVDMNLQIMHGNPVFRGTRIPVYQIIEELADGTPLREIPEGYPSLTVEQIQNGLDFAASVLRIYDDQISSR